MRFLLDTHVFLWWINGDRKLPKIVQEEILQAQDVYVSSASIWEAAIKVELKKLQVNINDLAASIEKSGFNELPITIKHAAAIQNLPNIHRDPFDRILIAQSIIEPLTLLTCDAILKEYSTTVRII